LFGPVSFLVKPLAKGTEGQRPGALADQRRLVDGVWITKRFKRPWRVLFRVGLRVFPDQPMGRRRRSWIYRRRLRFFGRQCARTEARSPDVRHVAVQLFINACFWVHMGHGDVFSAFSLPCIAMKARRIRRFARSGLIARSWQHGGGQRRSGIGEHFREGCGRIPQEAVTGVAAFRLWLPLGPAAKGGGS